MSRTITAYFDSRTDAQAASDRLVQAGVSNSEISIHDEASRVGGATLADDTRDAHGSEAPRREHKGFFESIADFFMPDSDRETYAEGLRRGGCVLTVRSDALSFDALSDILEEAGAVDLDTREGEWRSQGWAGTSKEGTSGLGEETAASRAAGQAAYRDVDTTRSDVGISGDRSQEANRMTGGTGLGVGSAASAIAGDDEAARAQPGRVGVPVSTVQGVDHGSRGTLEAGSSIPAGLSRLGEGVSGDSVSREADRLRMGRRETDHGRTRLRSYVADDAYGETPRAGRTEVEIEAESRRDEADRARRGA